MDTESTLCAQRNPARCGRDALGVIHATWRRRASPSYARAADLPIEQPSKFELVVNLKAAKDLGIDVPKSILVQADEVLR